MEKEKKKILSKGVIIASIIGLLVGIGLTVLTGFLLDYFVKSEGIAKLKGGEEAIATVDGKTISAQTLYDKTMLTNGLNLVIKEVDTAMFKDMYTLTEKEEKDVQEEAKYYLDYYGAQGVTEEEFLQGNGFKNKEEFLEDIRTTKKSTKYIYEYLEKKLEEGAVQKYYDENKDTLETYDSEHILVRISDTVTEEQALAQANEIIGKLNEGKTFEQIVEEYGDKIVHEELGFQGKTASLEQPYIDELVALKDGEYSKTPVKTSYGYHIVHRLATATIDDLRPTIIEILAEDIITADNQITYKAFVELRKEHNLIIHDEKIKAEYDKYCEQLNKQ